MFDLAKCPACGRFAAGVSEWPTDQPVRCPHCLAQFVLGGAIVQSLPQLIPAPAVEDDTSSAVVEMSPVPRALPPVEPPAGESGSPTGETEPPAEELTVEPPPAPLAGRSVEAQAGTLPPSYAEAYDFLPLEQKQQLEAAAAVAARLRGRTRRRSCVGEVVKVILGGILGLAIGYWVLNYFGGERFDWLSVYLPGCPHTQDHWPTEYFQQKSTQPAAEPPEQPPAFPRNHSIHPRERNTGGSSVSPPPKTVPKPVEPPASAEPDVPAESAKPSPPAGATDAPNLPGLDAPPGGQLPEANPRSNPAGAVTPEQPVLPGQSESTMRLPQNSGAEEPRDE